MLTKTKGALVASALALAVAGGSVAVLRAASSGSENVASAALPGPIGSAATARVPSGAGAGSADGVGGTSGATGTGTGPAAGGGQGGAGPTEGMTAPGQVRSEPPLAATAGQGDQGPLPAGSVSADGAVPGALTALRTLAATRAAITALPHSPQLLGQLAGSGGWAGNGATPAPSSSVAPSSTTATTAAPATGASDPTATATATATPIATATPTATATATPTAASMPTAIAPAAPAADSAATADSAAAAADSAATADSAAGADSAAAPMTGIDVAGYQHPSTGQYPKGVPIGWSQVAAAGYRFAAVKATEGDYYVNPWAATDLAEAKAAGLAVTPYHFAIPNGSSGQQQAEFAVEYSGYAPGPQTLPLMLDIEYDPYVSTDHTNECYGLSATQMTAWLTGFVTTVQSLTGQHPIIYTTANWWDTCTGRSTAFGADPMWVAAYGFASPPLPAGWPNWSFWQYTSGGRVAGVDSPGTTDLDWFSSTAIGLINPGPLASRPLGRVSVPLDSLAALTGEQLTWTAVGLPPGVRVTSGGVLTGMIVKTGSALGPVMYRTTVTARNAAGASSTVTFNWQVAASCPQQISLGVCLGT